MMQKELEALYRSIEKGEEITNELLINLCLHAKGMGLDHDDMVTLEEMYLPDVVSGDSARWPLIEWCIERYLPPLIVEDRAFPDETEVLFPRHHILIWRN